MAESKTQGARPETDEAGKAPAKPRRAAEKTAKAAPKTAKAGPKGAKAAAKTRKAAPKGTATARAGKASKAGAAPGKTAKAAPKAEKPTPKPRKAATKAAPEAKRVTARTAGDAARDAPPPAAVAPRTPAPTAPAPPSGTAAATPPVQRKTARARRPAKRKVVEDTARRYFAALAALEPASMASYWSPEGIQDSVPLGVFRGPEAVRRHYEEMFGAMPDMRVAVERITADDRVAAVQWRASGTFSGGPFQGVEPTGRRVELRGIDCLEITEHGKIIRNTSVYDGAAVARGMGLLPPEDSGAERAIRAGLNTVTKLRRAMAGRGGADG